MDKSHEEFINSEAKLREGIKNLQQAISSLSGDINYILNNGAGMGKEIHDFGTRDGRDAVRANLQEVFRRFLEEKNRIWEKEL